MIIHRLILIGMIPAAFVKILRRPGKPGMQVTLAGLTAWVLLGSGLLAPQSPSIAAEPPARGMFLVATRELQDSNFSESVILLVQHDELGTMGLVINQPSEMRLDPMLPEVDLGSFDGKLYVGGPVATYGVILLVHSPTAPADAEHVFGDVYASGSRELLFEIISSGEAPSRVRLYAGHAGWSPGQLDREIALGSWQVIPANESMIFSDEPTKIWRQLAPPQRPIIVRVD